MPITSEPLTRAGFSCDCSSWICSRNKRMMPSKSSHYDSESDTPPQSSLIPWRIFLLKTFVKCYIKFNSSSERHPFSCQNTLMHVLKSASVQFFCSRNIHTKLYAWNINIFVPTSNSSLNHHFTLRIKLKFNQLGLFIPRKNLVSRFSLVRSLRIFANKDGNIQWE